MSINLPLALAMIVSGTLVGTAIVYAAAQTPSDPWQRLKREAPVGNVELRPMPPNYWEPLPPATIWNGNFGQVGKDNAHEPKGNAPDGWAIPWNWNYGRPRPLPR